jgi:uncharacterized protein (UPF0276 family)
MMTVATIPARAGIGLKPQHYQEILRDRPGFGFFEVHAENYMGAGGPPHHYLEAVRKDYPISLHGVALSIGGEIKLPSFMKLTKRHCPLPIADCRFNRLSDFR